MTLGALLIDLYPGDLTFEEHERYSAAQGVLQADSVRSAREAAGLTVAQLALAVRPLKVADIRRLEAGGGSFTPSGIRDIARVLQLDMQRDLGFDRDVECWYQHLRFPCADWCQHDVN